MTIISNSWFIARWLIFALALFTHRIYQFTVFLSKPGAAILLAYLAHALTLYLHIKHVGAPSIAPDLDWVNWYEGLRAWVTYDLTERGALAYIEIPLLISAIAFHAFPFRFLKRALGLFPAMAKPLPPVRRLKTKPTKVKSVKVRAVIRPARQTIPAWPFRNVRGLSDELKQVMGSNVV